MSSKTETVGSMAALSKMTPRNSRDSRGRCLPIRYRVAERMLAETPSLRTVAWSEAR